MELKDFKAKLEELVRKCEQFLKTDELKRRGKPEDNTKQSLIRPFFELLGYTFKQEIIPEFKVVKKPSVEWVDYALLNDEGIPLVFVEAESLYDTSLTPFQDQILNYLRDYNRPGNAVNSEGIVVSWGLLTNFNEMRFFHIGDKEPFLSLKSNEFVSNAELIWNLLEFNNLKNDKIAAEYKERTRKELDKEFLSDLKKWRLIIANGFKQLQPGLSIEEIKEASQRWLDRLIFIRIFENKGLLPYHWIRKVYASWQKDTINKEVSPFADEVRKKFREFESLYNTELFKPNLSDRLKIDDKFVGEVIKVFDTQDPEVQKIIGSGQQKLADYGIYGYNFNSLTLDVLGSIYERYLAHDIAIKNGVVVIEETMGLRKEEGVYYTPQYIIEYVLNNTLKPRIEAILRAAKDLLSEGKYKDAQAKIETISSIKVLDPACGSGSFLIKAFDILAKCYMDYNEEVRKKIGEIVGKKAGVGQSLDAYSDMPILVEDSGEKVLLHNIHGVDMDRQAVEITKLNLWRALILLEPQKYNFMEILKGGKRTKLPMLEANVKRGDSLIDDSSVSDKAFRWEEHFKSVLDGDRFDIVIGNPPYGAKLGEKERAYISEKYSVCKSYKNSALAFIQRGFTLLSKTGALGFIVPKSLTFSEGWSEGVELILPSLRCLVDASKAFRDVLLEQVVIILDREKPEQYYESAFFEDGKVSSYVSIPKDTYSTCRTLMTSITPEEFEIYKKMNSQNHYFRDISRTFRGLSWQKYVNTGGKTGILRGDHIERFGIRDSADFVDLGRISEGNSKVGLLRQPKLVSQNIVAHVLKPAPHIIIMSALDREGLLNLDTVNNTVSTNKDYTFEYLLCILNCRLTSWYAYRFVYNKAVRTMHFDDYYVGRIPIPRVVDQRKFIDLANKMMQLIQKRRTLSSAFWNLCANRKSEEKSLLWLLSNSSLVDAVRSRNINPKTWGKVKYDRFEVEASGNTITVKSSGSTLMNIVFTDPDLALYVYFVLGHYREEGKLVDKTLAGLCEYISIPVILPNPSVELKKKVVDELRRAHDDIDLRAVDQSILETDREIDKLVFASYSLTDEEIILVMGY